MSEKEEQEVGLNNDKSRELIKERGGGDSGNEDAIKMNYVRKESIYKLIAKWIVGLYVIGALVLILEVSIGYSTFIMSEPLLSTKFLNIELSALGNYIRAPLIVLLITAPYTILTILFIFIARLIIDKFNLFTGKHRVAYLALLTITLILNVTTMYLGG